MEELRLAALQAFYAFPHGGAEVGGILFGDFDGARVRLAAFRPVPCEHATGPSFTLSEKDLARMAEVLRVPARDPALTSLRPVGWYHSHTRSGVFLSGQDLEVHERFFPQPWQVALVLRPSGSGTRAGFFARDAEGRMRLDGSYREIALEPLGARVLSRPAAAAPAPAAAPPQAAAHKIPAATASRPEPLSRPGAAAAAPASQPVVEPPSFLAAPPRRRTGVWPAVVGVVLLATGVGAFATREYWLKTTPRGVVISPEVPVAKSEPVALTATDHGGQLLIRWNGSARTVAEARAAALEFADGTARTMIVLGPEQLRGGTFTYVRQTERPDGRRSTETTSFLGSAPAPAASASAAEAELVRQRDQLQAQLHEARTQLVNQTLLIQKLQRMIREMQASRLAAPAAQPPRTAPAQTPPPAPGQGELGPAQ